jgi:PAS domain S-box-containing protein
MTVNALDGRYLHVNPAYQRLVGYAADELLDPAFDLNTLAHPDDRPRMAELQHQLLAGRIPAFFLEKRYVRKDGSIIWVRVTGTARRDAAGRPVQFIRLVEDIDDRKRAEAQREHLLDRERAARTEAERASRMKDEFLATLSHELRTPLNAILGWSHILLDATPPGSELAQGLEVIVRNARAQTQIIEDLLDMSRIISGKLRLDVHPTPLAPIVQAAVDTVRPAADARGVLLRAALDPADPGHVSADPNRLQQVFWNLLTNAVKFTPRGGHVQVTLARADDDAHLEVTVADTGEGIRPEFLPHVFDRFRQADASTTRRHGGLGLGLAIVKQLVELHGGTVRAASPGPGQGATFTVTLPVATPDPQPAATPTPLATATATATSNPTTPTTTTTTTPAPAEPARPDLPDLHGRLAGLRALVVDDEPDTRDLVRRLLEARAATVTTAASAAEALDHLRQQPFDVLLSDIGMPGEDGYALIRRVRALPDDGGGNVPAIALTAYARAEDRVKALLAGFQHHVPKPVDPAELLATVAALARPHHSHP